MRSILKNKKGDVFQIFFALIILFIVAVTGLFAYAMAKPMNEKIAEFMPNNSVGEEVIEKIATQTPTVLDETVFLLFLGIVVGLMISAVRTNFSPVVIFLFILLFLIAILVASGMVNIYQGFAQAPTLTDVASDLTLTNIVFSRYTPLFICLISALIMILMYSKSGGDIQV